MKWASQPYRPQGSLWRDARCWHGVSTHCGGFGPEDQVPPSSGPRRGRQLGARRVGQRASLTSSHGTGRSCTPSDKTVVGTVAFHHKLVKRVAETAATVLSLFPAPSAVLGLWAQKRTGRVHGPRKRWRGVEPLLHVRVVRRSLALFPLSSGPASRAKWW